MTLAKKSVGRDVRRQEWISMHEAATRYSISVDTIRRSISSGDLPASRYGRRLIRVRVDDLDLLFRPIPVGSWPVDNRSIWAS